MGDGSEQDPNSLQLARLPGLLDRSEYPELYAALRRGGEDAMHAELSRLLGRYFHARAPRKSLGVRATMHTSEHAAAIPIRVQDVSATGARVHVAHSDRADVMRAGGVSLVVHAKDGEELREVRLYAELVRVAGTDDDGVSLGFRFTDMNPAKVRLVGCIVEPPED